MKKIALLLALAMLMMSTAFAASPTGEGVYPVADEVVELTMWCSTIADRDYWTCDMTKIVEEKMGIKLNFTQFTGSTDTAYNLLLASDPSDWPDLIMGLSFSTSQISMGVEAGMLLPLNDLIDEYGINYRAALEENPVWERMLTAPDGNIYTCMYTDSGVHKDSEYKVFVKESWLEALEMDMPTTPDEFKDLLIAIRDTDLNGNGEADEIPMMGYYNGRKTDPICFLMNPFELYTDNYFTISDDGEIVFHANTDGWREGLAYIADLYAEGLIAPETYVQDETQWKAILNVPSADAQIGVIPCWYQGAYIDANILNWVDYEPIAPLKGDSGLQQSAARFGGNFNLNSAITTTCKNPEAAFKVLDWFLGNEGLWIGFYGAEGTNYEFIDAPSFYGDEKSVKRITTDIETLWNSGHFPRADKAEARYATTMDPSAVYTDNTYVLVHAAQAYEPYYVNHNTPDIVWCADDDILTARTNLSTTINDYVKEMDTKFIMGTLDITSDEAWDEYLAGLEARGLETYLETLAAYYGLN